MQSGVLNWRRTVTRAGQRLKPSASRPVSQRTASPLNGRKQPGSYKHLSKPLRSRSCRFYKKTRREYEATKSEGIVYMENNCVAPSARCPAGRIDFILARRSDVTSFGVSVGIRSIRACMHECIDSTLFYCRSFQVSLRISLFQQIPVRSPILRMFRVGRGIRRGRSLFQIGSVRAVLLTGDSRCHL